MRTFQGLPRTRKVYVATSARFLHLLHSALFILRRPRRPPESLKPHLRGDFVFSAGEATSWCPRGKSQRERFPTSQRRNGYSVQRPFAVGHRTCFLSNDLRHVSGKLGQNVVIYRVTRVLCSKLLFTFFGLFRCLPDLPWADGNRAELA